MGKGLKFAFWYELWTNERQPKPHGLFQKRPWLSSLVEETDLQKSPVWRVDKDSQVPSIYVFQPPGIRLVGILQPNSPCLKPHEVGSLSKWSDADTEENKKGKKKTSQN